jgi:hypothetical protein
MPHACHKDGRVSPRRNPAPRRLAPSRFAAVFKLDNPDDHRARDWVERFHAPGGIHRLLDIARACGSIGPAHVLMLTRSHAKRAAARPEFLVLRYEPAVIRVSWKAYPSLDEARAAFAAAVEASSPASEPARS